MDIYQFSHKYKNFRRELIEEVGDMEENNIIELFRIFLLNNVDKKPYSPYPSDFNNSSIPYKWHFNNKFKNQSADDSNDDDYDDDLPSW